MTGTSRLVHKLPVKDGEVFITYIGTRDQLKGFREDAGKWKRSIRKDPGPRGEDSLEYAQLAATRWSQEKTKGRTASSLSRLREMIKRQPEISVLAVAHAPWLPAAAGRMAGFCYFRRTWCNNIRFEFIAVHPYYDDQDQGPLSRLGTGLLFHVACVAAAIDANAVWGEVTEVSRDFYKPFGPQPACDLATIERDKYRAFLTSIREKWGFQLPESVIIES